jgi:hypothetical protein
MNYETDLRDYLERVDALVKEEDFKFLKGWLPGGLDYELLKVEE